MKMTPFQDSYWLKGSPKYARQRVVISLQDAKK